MPILPLIDLLILMSTASLVVGFVLKAIDLTTRYQPTVLGFSSLDFVLITGICMGLALVLAARSWVKLNEAEIRSVRSHSGSRRTRRRRQQLEDEAADEHEAADEEQAFEEAEQARAKMS